MYISAVGAHFRAVFVPEESLLESKIVLVVPHIATEAVIYRQSSVCAISTRNVAIPQIICLDPRLCNWQVCNDDNILWRCNDSRACQLLRTTH